MPLSFHDRASSRQPRVRPFPLDGAPSTAYNWSMTRELAPVLSLLAFLAFTPASGRAQSPPAAVPRFEAAPCPVETAPGERIDCGALFVPENRGKPASRTIRLPVMIFRSRSATPAPDPLVFLAGGPGNSTVARRRSGKQLPFLDQRDYVLLEQRGTRYAQPALECPATNQTRAEISAGRLRGEAAEAELLKAAGECRQSLVSSGVDLDGYTSAAIADDLEDLRVALRYPAWNLHGLSYGTRLALTVLRRHPAGVRSVMLDSVLPPEVNFDEVSATNLLRSLNAVFDGCAVDRDCGAAFPGLRPQFAGLVARADRAPLSLPLVVDEAAGGKPVEVRGEQVVDAIYAALHNPQAIPDIPRIIDNAASGRYTELSVLVQSNQGPSSFSWGMRYSVWCAEEMPFEDPARVASQVSPALGLGGLDEGAATPAVCRAWNVKPAPPVENEPVTSNVPTLIFAGEFDPDTPPQWGRQLLAGLSKGYYVEMRGQSHGAAFNPCGVQIMTAFLNDPAAAPPVGCALSLRGADFGLSARSRR
jgi:pimeloyl-ACP methyl ester carboxylesterase